MLALRGSEFRILVVDQRTPKLGPQEQQACPKTNDSSEQCRMGTAAFNPKVQEAVATVDCQLTVTRTVRVRMRSYKRWQCTAIITRSNSLFKKPDTTDPALPLRGGSKK